VRAVVLLTLLSSVPLCAAEPVAATPWDVRRDAQELLDDLAHHRGDESNLLAHAQTFMADHGEALISIDDGSAPVYEVIQQKLRDLGMDKSFIATFQQTAANHLSELGTSPTDQQLLSLARSYPGTDAAQQCWSTLADRAWDRGTLNRFLSYGRSAGDNQDKPDAVRHQRYLAAQALLSPSHTTDLPSSFDGLTEIWRLPVELQSGRPQLNRQVDHPVQSLSLTAIPGEAVAASDGIQVLVIDHLIGRQQAPPVSLGETPLPPHQSRPAVIRDGFAALGETSNGQRVIVVGIDEVGTRLWQTLVPAENQSGVSPIISVSAPLAFDNLVVFAVTTQEEDNVNLVVHALDAHSGAPVWDSEVARLPGARRLGQGDATSLTPMTCVHDGSLLVLSNCGVLARVGADGAVQRIWGYPSTNDDLNGGVALFNHTDRPGAILSDSETAVITPADNTGIALLMKGDGNPEIYRGDGAGGTVLAVADGLAVFGLRAITCLDLATKSALWSHPLHAILKNPQAFIGENAILVYGDESKMLLSRKDGKGSDDKPFEAHGNLNLTVVDQTLIFGGSDFISAWGGSASTLDQISAAAKASPGDFRPRVRLAALLQAHGDATGSFDNYLQALRLGAPVDYAERAAHGIRERLDLTLGDPKAFPAEITKLDALTTFDSSLRNEAIWWRARDAETRGDAAGAVSGYRQITSGPPHTVLLRDGVQADLRLLAHGGLYRLHQELDPLAGTTAIAPLPMAGSSWTTGGYRARNSRVSGDMALAFMNGFLTGLRLKDGSQAWTRTPNRPLLGVQNTEVQRQDGVVVHVMSGSSAEAAGMLSGDVLVQFNDTELHSFGDLLHAITGSPLRMPYTVTVLRGDQRVALKGVLGGEQVAPIASNARTVLVGPVTVEPRREGMWVSALDLETGQELFTPAWTIKPSDKDTEAQLPLLTDDDTIIIEDGSDIVAIRAHATPTVASGHELWRIVGRSHALDHSSLIGSRLLWLSSPEHGRGELVELSTGQTVASVPSDSPLPPLIDGYDIFARQGDLTVCCWDLAAGRLRWRSAQTVSVVVAANSDSLYVVTQEGQLAILDRFSGAIRRTLGDWSGVSPLGASGDQEFLQVRDHDVDAVVALNLQTGTVTWQQPIPDRTELTSVTTSSQGMTMMLREGDSGWILRLQADGRLSGVAPAEADHEFFPLANGLLDAGPRGFQVLTPTLPVAQGRIHSTAVEDNADLAQMANNALPHLIWNDCGGGCAFAIVRCGTSLLVLSRGDKDVVVHLADAGHTMDSTGMMATLSPSDSTVRFDHGTGSWVMLNQARIGTDVAPILVARLDPPPDRSGTWPLAIRAEAAGAADAPPGPWWLISTWHVLVAGEETTKPGSAPSPAPAASPTPKK